MEDSSSNPGNPSSGNAGNIQRGVDRVSSAAHETVDKLASEATHMADRISDQTRRMTEAPTRALECSKSWVQDKPLEAVGIALAVGFVIGRLTAH